MQQSDNKNLDPRSPILGPDVSPRSSIPDPDVSPRSSILDPAPETDEINLLDLLLVLAKHWRMIVGVPCIVAVVTAIITLCMPNIYTAKAMILPGDDDKGLMGAMMAQMGGLANLAGGALGGPTKTDLYVTMLKSETIKDPVIDRFKLMQVYEAKFRTDAYKTLDAKVTISAGKKDGVLSISVDDKDPKRAAAMANAYVDELGKLAAGLSMTGAGKNRTFLEGRLAEAKADLAQAEEALKNFQSKYKAVSVTDQAKASIEGVAQLRAQLAAQEVQLASLQRQFTDNSQEVKGARSAIANIRGQIARLEGGGGNSSIPSVGSVPKLGQEYVRLMREFKIQETLVELLTKQYEMNKLTEAKNVSPFQLLQKAKVPERKSKPKRSLIVIMAAFTIGLLMVPIAFLKEFSAKMSPDDRQRWEQISVQLPPLPVPLQRLATKLALLFAKEK
jgi:uncharacterized protein involved in exopolysaccharide biosynthesis